MTAGTKAVIDMYKLGSEALSMLVVKGLFKDYVQLLSETHERIQTILMAYESFVASRSYEETSNLRSEYEINLR